MVTSNRAALYLKIHKVLRKHYEPIVPATRPLLEHMLYGCLLEHSPYEAADEVFARLQQSYFDWNEMRVTSVVELAEMLTPLVSQNAAAAHFKRVLQSVFEANFAFELEPLKKQNIGKAIQQLEKYSPDSRFAVAYATQLGLQGHFIPLAKGELNLLFVLGALSEAELQKGEAPGLERAIPKNKGTEFSSLLHQFAVEFMAHPNGSKVKAVLLEIDPNSKVRLKQYMALLQAAADAKDARREARKEAAREERREAARTQAAEAAKPLSKKDPAKGSPAPPTPQKGAASVKPEGSGKPAPAEKPSPTAKGSEKNPAGKSAEPARKTEAPARSNPAARSERDAKKKPPEKTAEKARPAAGKAPPNKSQPKKPIPKSPPPRASAKNLARKKPR